MDYSIRIGGEAGQGIQTVGGSLARVFAREGYHVFTHQDYMSRIRGGHNYYQVRVSHDTVTASRDRLDIILAMDRATIENHRPFLNKGGLIIYDADTVGKTFEGDEFLHVPLEKLAVENGGDKIMANAVAVGAVLGVLDLPVDPFVRILKETLKKKGEEVIHGNEAAARAGAVFVQGFADRLGCFRLKPSGREARMLIDGASAIGLGALLSGCKFYSAYPMTPSTGIMNFLAGMAERHGLIVEQAEDEIAAINMALGASYAGVRAMTGTSGGGFALMQEGLSLAGMTETPIVIAEMQRPGPATGLPTRTEQADLLFIVHGGHGEFPRVVFTPGTPEQAFYLTHKAFELAEKYQIPVFIQGDQYLGDCEWTLEGLDLNRMVLTDHRVRGRALKNLPSYKRYTHTGTGVSPLAIPGSSRHLVVVDSDEHDEDGHIIEDAETRSRMMEKRLFRKWPLIRNEISPPTTYGHDNPEVVLVGYGSTYGVMKEAVDQLGRRTSVAMLHFSEVYPLPPEAGFHYMNFLQKAGTTICIENNATGQFARLLRAETGFVFSGHINRYDGRPFTVESLLEKVHDYTG